MKLKINPYLVSFIAFALTPAVHAATGTWAVDASGLWSEATNWSGEIIADGDTFFANFTNDITEDRIVSLDSPRTLNRLTFSDSATATPGSWLIDNNGDAANILTLGHTGPIIAVNALGTGKTAEISAVLAGNSARIRKNGTGTLVLSGANTYSVGMIIAGGVTIMNNASANVGGSSAATTTTGSDFAINSTSAFRQSAGTVTITGVTTSNSSSNGYNGMIIGSGSYGAYELSGGTLQFNDPWRLNARRAQITQTGGEWNINYNGNADDSIIAALANGRQFMIGSGNERGVIYATAGTTTITTAANLTGAVLIVSDTTNSGTGNENGADLTIAGSADWTVSGGAGFIHLTRDDSGTETGNLNLNGNGRLTTNGISLGDTAGIGRLNFNGGTLRAGIDNAAFLQGITSARIYSGGATIDTNGKNITIGQNLDAPTGDGLTSVAITEGGSGYIGAPIVTITGGDGGTGATAVADFDATTGTVTGITITNPGSDYISAPTVAIAWGSSGGSDPTLGDITLSPLTSGGLTKTGSGTLALTGSSTYTGATTVNEGTLAITITGSLDATDVEVKNNATLAGNGLLGGNVIVRTGGHQAFEVVDTAGFQTPMEITGSLTLEADTIIDLTAAVPPAPGGPYILLTAGSITGTPGSVTLNGLLGTVAINGNNLELTVTAPAGFAGWITTPAFGLAPEDQDPMDDPDNDGIANLLEYVLQGGDPSASNTAILPTLVASGTDFVFTYFRRTAATGTTQTFQYGNDLSGWTDVPVTDGGLVSITSPEAGIEQVVITIPKGTETKLFGRLQVTQP